MNKQKSFTQLRLWMSPLNSNLHFLSSTHELCLVTEWNYLLHFLCHSECSENTICLVIIIITSSLSAVCKSIFKSSRLKWIYAAPSWMMKWMSGKAQTDVVTTNTSNFFCFHFKIHFFFVGKDIHEEEQRTFITTEWVFCAEKLVDWSD